MEHCKGKENQRSGRQPLSVISGASNSVESALWIDRTLTSPRPPPPSTPPPQKKKKKNQEMAPGPQPGREEGRRREKVQEAGDGLRDALGLGEAEGLRPGMREREREREKEKGKRERRRRRGRTSTTTTTRVLEVEKNEKTRSPLFFLFSLCRQKKKKNSRWESRA